MTADCDLPVSLKFTEIWLSIFNMFIDVGALDMFSHDTHLPYGLEDSVKLASTIDRLTIHIEQFQEPNFTEENLPKAKFFFLKADTIRFVNAFFDNCNHSNCFVHKGSFNVNIASTQLLLAVLLLGATCTSPEDAAIVEGFSERESRVFHVWRSRISTTSVSRESSKTFAKYIQLVQVTMLTIVLQTSSQLNVRRRIRIWRMPALVFVVRFWISPRY